MIYFNLGKIKETLMKISQVFAATLFSCMWFLTQAHATWVDGTSDVPKNIATAITKFSQGEGCPLLDKDEKFVSPKLIEIDDKTFYGIHESDLLRINYAQFKKELAKIMGLKTFKMIQFIGS